MFRLFRKQLFEAFFDWLEVNQKTIGEKWYVDLYNKGKDAEADCNTTFKVFSSSMWMFNMVSNLGVSAGLGIHQEDNYFLQGLSEGIDEKSTRRLLMLMGSCLDLQKLPREILEKEYPIMSAKHFSLGLWVKEHAGEIG